MLPAYAHADHTDTGKQLKNLDIMNEKNYAPESLMMEYRYDPDLYRGAIKCPVFHTSSFVFNTAEEGKAFFEKFNSPATGSQHDLELVYSRANNPNVEILEDRLKLWDGGESAAVFSSGMSAIATSLLSFLKPGDVLLYSNPIYGGTHKFINFVLKEFGISFASFNAGDSEEDIIRNIEAGGMGSRLKMIFIESPANPTNDLIDIEMCSRIAAHFSTTDKKVLVSVDNTFMGPLWQHPLKLGADLVLYSATKYIGGHSDLIAGAAVSSHDLIQTIKKYRTILGTIADPQTSWLIMRSLETMKIRMEAAANNAAIIADYLRSHPKVEKVYYLGFTDMNRPSQLSILKKQCSSNGAMISFDLKGGEKEAFVFLNNLKHIKLAVSLGGTESLVEHPYTMTHSDIPVDEKEALGVTGKMIRLSVGIENPQDLISDIETALNLINQDV